MNQPVRLGLVFPRSGQQLFVNVPIQLNEIADTSREHHVGLETLFPTNTAIVKPTNISSSQRHSAL